MNSWYWHCQRKFWNRLNQQGGLKSVWKQEFSLTPNSHKIIHVPSQPCQMNTHGPALTYERFILTLLCYFNHWLYYTHLFVMKSNVWLLFILQEPMPLAVWEVLAYATKKQWDNLVPRSLKSVYMCAWCLTSCRRREIYKVRTKECWITSDDRTWWNIADRSLYNMWVDIEVLLLDLQSFLRHWLAHFNYHVLGGGGVSPGITPQRLGH